jgi:glutamate transport system permease protein
VAGPQDGGEAVSVLYDHPGPRARRRNAVLTVLFGLGLLALLWFVYRRFDRTGQWAADKWRPFLGSNVWVNFILPGLWATVSAAAVAMVLALTFGVVFAVLRLSPRRPVAVAAGAVVEFFRAVPLLLMIFFLFYGLPFIIQGPVPAFWGLVIGLTLYNGSVLAEAFRAGVKAVPRGQSEAAAAIGLRDGQIMRYVLMPQAARAMLPVIVSQLVVLLKDTALGYIIAYPELLQRGSEITANYSNVVPLAIVLALIYIAINSALTLFAGWLERRTRRYAPGAVAAAHLAAPETGSQTAGAF